MSYTELLTNQTYATVGVKASTGRSQIRRQRALYAYLVSGGLAYGITRLSQYLCSKIIPIYIFVPCRDKLVRLTSTAARDVIIHRTLCLACCQFDVYLCI